MSVIGRSMKCRDGGFCGYAKEFSAQPYHLIFHIMVIFACHFPDSYMQFWRLDELPMLMVHSVIKSNKATLSARIICIVEVGIIILRHTCLGECKNYKF